MFFRGLIAWVFCVWSCFACYKKIWNFVKVVAQWFMENENLKMVDLRFFWANLFGTLFLDLNWVAHTCWIYKVQNRPTLVKDGLVDILANNYLRQRNIMIIYYDIQYLYCTPCTWCTVVQSRWYHYPGRIITVQCTVCERRSNTVFERDDVHRSVCKTIYSTYCTRCNTVVMISQKCEEHIIPSNFL